MRDLLGGRAPISPRWRGSSYGPPGFTISDRESAITLRTTATNIRRVSPRALQRESRESKSASAQIRDAKNPLLCRCARARGSRCRNDGHGAESRPYDEDGEGAGGHQREIRASLWEFVRRFCQMFGDVVLKLKPENRPLPIRSSNYPQHKKAALRYRAWIQISASTIESTWSGNFAS